MDAPWQGYPWALLKLAFDDRSFDVEADWFLDACEHQLDPFSKKFRTTFHPKEKLRSPGAHVLLKLLALFMRLTITQVECRHALIRRLLILLGQTWRQELAYISSEFVQIRARILQLTTSMAVWEDESSGSNGKNTGWSHGGACRAFLSQFLLSEEGRSILDAKESLHLDMSGIAESKHREGRCTSVCIAKDAWDALRVQR